MRRSVTAMLVVPGLANLALTAILMWRHDALAARVALDRDRWLQGSLQIMEGVKPGWTRRERPGDIVEAVSKPYLALPVRG